MSVGNDKSPKSPKTKKKSPANTKIHLKESFSDGLSHKDDEEIYINLLDLMKDNPIHTESQHSHHEAVDIKLYEAELKKNSKVITSVKITQSPKTTQEKMIYPVKEIDSEYEIRTLNSNEYKEYETKIATCHCRCQIF